MKIGNWQLTTDMADVNKSIDISPSDPVPDSGQGNILNAQYLQPTMRTNFVHYTVHITQCKLYSAHCTLQIKVWLHSTFYIGSPILVQEKKSSLWRVLAGQNFPPIRHLKWKVVETNPLWLSRKAQWSGKLAEAHFKINLKSFLGAA